MIVYIYNIGVDLYNGFNGLRHRINWTYFAVLDGLAHPLYSGTEKRPDRRNKSIKRTTRLRKKRAVKWDRKVKKWIRKRKK